MSKVTPTQRSLKHYKDLGFTCQKVERWQSFGKPGEAMNLRAGFGKSTGHRVDLFGIIDIVALGPEPIGDDWIYGIQCCGLAFSDHVKKILAEPRAKRWMECGGKLILIGWSKRKDGTKREHYVPRIREFNVFDFAEVPVCPQS